MNIVRDVIKPIGKGLKITMRHFLEPKDTVSYPEQRKEQFARTRWRHVLLRYENGLERCIGCSLCAGACPVRCIYVEAADNTDTERYSPGERYAKRTRLTCCAASTAATAKTPARQARLCCARTTNWRTTRASRSSPPKRCCWSRCPCATRWRMA